MLPSAPAALVRLYSLTHFSFQSSESSSRPGRITRMFRGWESMQNFFSAKAEQTKNFFSTKTDDLYRVVTQVKNSEETGKITRAVQDPLFLANAATSVTTMALWNTVRPDAIAFEYLTPPLWSYVAKPALFASALFMCHAYGQGIPTNEALQNLSDLYTAGAGQIKEAYTKYAQASDANEGEKSQARRIYEIAKTIPGWLSEHGIYTLRGTVKVGLPLGAVVLAATNLLEAGVERAVGVQSPPYLAESLAITAALADTICLRLASESH